MTNPIFKRKPGRRSTASLERERLEYSYLDLLVERYKTPTPPKLHQCEGSWTASKEAFGTSYGQFSIAWNCVYGWHLTKEIHNNEDVMYKGQLYRNLRQCPFCQCELPVVNEVTIQ